MYIYIYKTDKKKSILIMKFFRVISIQEIKLTSNDSSSITDNIVVNISFASHLLSDCFKSFKVFSYLSLVTSSATEFFLAICNISDRRLNLSATQITFYIVFVVTQLKNTTKIILS